MIGDITGDGPDPGRHLAGWSGQMAQRPGTQREQRSRLTDGQTGTITKPYAQ